MDEYNYSNIENYGSLEYWKSRPPEEVLEAFINELKGPLASIKGYVEMMHLNDSKELRTKALDVISRIIEKIEKDEELIKGYLIELKRKS